MSAISTTPARRAAAARNAAQRRKLMVLAALAVILVVVLALELPKILKGSGSGASPSAASTSAATPAPTSAAAGADQSLAVASTAASAKRLRVIRHMSAKDPFTPLVNESATASATTSSSSSSSASSSSSSSAPASAPAASASRSKPAIVAVKPAPVRGKPVHVRPAAPTAAVLWTNGQRQVVGVSQVFSVGDAQFRLVSVTRKAVRLTPVGGALAGGKQAISVRKGHPLRLANTATGVVYRLLFSAAGSSGLVPTSPTSNR